MYLIDQVVHDVPHHVIDLDIRADHVDAKEACILIAHVEGREGVGDFIVGEYQSMTATKPRCSDVQA